VSTEPPLAVGRAAPYFAGVFRHMKPQSLLRGAAKFAAVAIGAVALGAVVGLGLSELSGDNVASTPTGPAAPGTTQTTTKPARTTAKPARTATKPTRTTTKAAQPSPARTQTTPSPALPRVNIVSAILQPAATASGRSRRRARLSIRVEVVNRGDRRLTWPAPQLISGTTLMRVDPNAGGAAGALLKPLARGATATGELRFETVGDVTSRLQNARRARLRIAGRTVKVRVTIGAPAKSSGPPRP
jgi:hypothetical protein